MKLFLFAIGGRERASSRLRVWDHVQWLRDQGHEVRVDAQVASAPSSKLAFYYRLSVRFLRWIGDFLWSDAALIQEATLLWPAALLKNVSKRRKLIFDFSDPVDRMGSGLKRRLRGWMFDLLVRKADVIIVENRRYVAHFGDDARVQHFYGPVDATRYEAGRLAHAGSERQALRIGWTGSPGTFAFIEPLMQAIDTLGRERDIELMLIGVKSAAYPFAFARPIFVDWDESSEFSIVPTFDLGLFRLDGSEDSLWRGAGKLFIYMAAGVPFVATGLGIAQAVMTEADTGFAVSSDDKWLDVLRRAVNDADVRVEMAARASAFAKTTFSYEVYRQQLLANLSVPSESMSRV